MTRGRWFGNIGKNTKDKMRRAVGKISGKDRNFLFLQGPHGPFFRQLGQALRATGAQVVRIGFNAGDEVFWRDRSSYIAFDRPCHEWKTFLNRVLDLHRITDIVLYGDTRPKHALAVEIAKRLGLRLHLFEEGYLRPYWVTYERAGTNGFSALADISVQQMQAALVCPPMRPKPAPDHWGDMREHVFYGAAYHWFVWFFNRKYRNFKPHRDITVRREFSLYFKKLAASPLHWAQRVRATRKIMRAGFPFHLVLLQLAHDASFRAHSPFANMNEFLASVMQGFAQGAPSHHHLVFKAHPLEDGRVPLRRDILRLAQKFGIEDRVHLLRGGKLARLLDAAQSAVTVNSTAGQQALWRGLPLLVFGDAVYCKPEFVARGPAHEFFRQLPRPDAAAYRDFRQFLLSTSQVPGGFYAARSRQQLMRNIVDLILSDKDPYQNLQIPKAAKAQQLRLVR